VTAYSYALSWESTHVDSSHFHDVSNHQNPDGTWPFSSALFVPSVLPFGKGYTLPATLQGRLSVATAVPFANTDALCSEQHGRRSLRQAAPPPRPPRLPPGPLPPPPYQACPWTSAGGKLYWSYAGSGASPATTPSVGDLRISWMDASDSIVSVIATQTPSGDANGSRTFAPYVARSGHSCYLMETGTVSAEEMILRAKARNTAATWILRFLFIFLNWAGLTVSGPATMRARQNVVGR